MEKRFILKFIYYRLNSYNSRKFSSLSSTKYQNLPSPSPKQHQLIFPSSALSVVSYSCIDAPTRPQIRRFASWVSDFDHDDDPSRPAASSRKPMFKRRLLMSQEERDRRHILLDDDQVGVEKPPLTNAIQAILTKSEWINDRLLSVDECNRLRQSIIDSRLEDAGYMVGNFCQAIDSSIMQSFLANDQLGSASSYLEFLLTSKDHLFNPGCVEPAVRVILDYFMLRPILMESISDRELNRRRSDQSTNPKGVTDAANTQHVDSDAHRKFDDSDDPEMQIDQSISSKAETQKSIKLAHFGSWKARKGNGFPTIRKQIDARIDELMIPIFDKMLPKFPAALRPHLIIHAMKGLACSSRWREVVEWQKSITLSQQNITDYSLLIVPLIVKSLESDQPAIALDLLCRYLEADVGAEINDSVHEALWKYSNSLLETSTSKKNRAVKVITEFIDIIRDAALFGSCLPAEYIHQVKKFFSRIPDSEYIVERSKILHPGKCRSCGQVLEKYSLSGDEFKTMSAEVINRLVSGANVYQWSTPNERNRFDRVLDNEGPFDVIVDGLNVVHSDNRVVGTARIQKLIDVLNGLRTNSDVKVKRILVLLRPYVKLDRYEQLGQEIRHMARVFICGHESVDDSYMLYGALSSGQQCYFMTNDYLRSQNHQFSKRTAASFQKWRRLRQIQFTNESNGNIKVVWPSVHAIRPQRQGAHYHIPLKNNVDAIGSTFNVKAHDAALTWLCIRPKA